MRVPAVSTAGINLQPVGSDNVHRLSYRRRTGASRFP
jgi:hypothetical protein